MNFLCFNGKFTAASEPIIHAGNKSYRYGDGFFETIRICEGKIPLKLFHKARIEKSRSLLQYDLPVSIDQIFNQIPELCALNNCSNSARVRLSFSHGDGTLFEKGALHYLIEATAYEHTTAAGLKLGVFQEIKKEVSPFSCLKLANAFIYSRAAQYCGAQNLNDCLILNTRQQVIESVISNIFWIKDGVTATTPLSDGCVAGVFRSFLLEHDPSIKEQTCTIETLRDADEIFLTNALRGVQSVRQLEEYIYADTITLNHFGTKDKNPFVRPF